MTRCDRCLAPVPVKLAYETPSGDTLCSTCYFELKGPKAPGTLAKRAKRLGRIVRKPSSK